ncbi:hypothetical protein [Klebsiella pneumoniae]|nr:hypothetical protein [Klebsiella pneumoniae]MCE0410145.1 hypothetical protein [Klebsiella pneumoniae]HBR4937747.1 hypothetical protein [Klebsiella pneumoniae]HBW7787281.1 hypothetical protein [Klebsiella pneumoniae]HCI4391959.1 hypothetical protein [Klebsiella pneumoniae]HDY8956435.1 hypothetical protein [Klebsiella pneumoniae]
MDIRWWHYVLFFILIAAFYNIGPEAIGRGLRELGGIIVDGMIHKN